MAARDARRDGSTPGIGAVAKGAAALPLHGGDVDAWKGAATAEPGPPRKDNVAARRCCAATPRAPVPRDALATVTRRAAFAVSCDAREVMKGITRVDQVENEEEEEEEENVGDDDDVTRHHLPATRTMAFSLRKKPPIVFFTGPG